MNTPKPSGLRGTKETLTGVALGRVTFDPIGGAVVIDYEGETEVFWEEQRTVSGPRGRVFVDDDGDEHDEADLLAAWKGEPAPDDDTQEDDVEALRARAERAEADFVRERDDHARTIAERDEAQRDAGCREYERDRYREAVGRLREALHRWQVRGLSGEVVRDLLAATTDEAILRALRPDGCDCGGPDQCTGSPPAGQRCRMVRDDERGR